jgi:hypothetical protein
MIIFPISFTHPIAHYTGLVLGAMVSAVTSDLIVTIRAPHFGKIFCNNQFIKFWRLFAYTVLLLTSFAVLFDLLSPYMDAFMFSNLNFYFGLSSLVMGIFFIWFVYAFDFSFKTQRKWVFPVVCFSITALNIVLIILG